MSDAPTPEQRAESLVAVTCRAPGEPYFLELRGPRLKPVRLGPYQNPDLAKGDARLVREFLAAVIREAGGGAPPEGGAAS
jgi:hypothetical protein